MNITDVVVYSTSDADGSKYKMGKPLAQKEKDLWNCSILCKMLWRYKIIKY